MNIVEKKQEDLGDTLKGAVIPSSWVKEGHNEKEILEIRPKENGKRVT